MSTNPWNPGAGVERKQLAFLALGAGAAAALFFALHLAVPFQVVVTVAAIAGVGAVGYRFCGRAIFLLFTLGSFAIGGMVSRLVVALAYGVAIAGVGSLARLFRMDRLQRDFGRCRAVSTLFVDAPKSDRESFGRQS